MRGSGGIATGLSGAAAILAAGCAHVGVESVRGYRDIEAPRCRQLRTTIADSIARAGVGDAEARPIANMPYLRVNRFLAFLGRNTITGRSAKVVAAWLQRLRALDEEGVRIELANLPEAELRNLATRTPGASTSRAKLAHDYNVCSRAYVERLLADRNRVRQLARTIRVADNYSDVAQTAGLFPLASIPIASGWQNWKRKNLASFTQPVSALPLEGRLATWSPRSPDRPLPTREVRDIIERSRDPHLGIPEPRGRDLRRLLQAFAPVWQVDVTGHYDGIGSPGWRRRDATIRIDRRQPTVFTRVSHAIVNGSPVLQLNYTVWFQQRPREGPFDLLGGHLDAVIWRVTLSRQGRPLVYDSIHACGCYHFIFPVGGPATWGRTTRSLKEVPAIVMGMKLPRQRQRVLLRLATKSHYLLGVTVADRQALGPETRAYRLRDDDALRSLPVSTNHRRSLYRPDGLVAGTERLERFLLWPTGVKSPGAIRQWGHHAIAFAERRHFDDPVLLSRLFNKK